MHRYNAREIAALFDSGENVINRINAKEGAQQNSSSAILYSYDAQAGSYVAQLEDPAHRDLKHKLGRYLSTAIDGLRPSSLLDAGVGEATSLVPLLNYLQHKPEHVLGFDISLSRLLFARRHLVDNGQTAILFAGALDRIPLETGSVDVVVTVHALEPNHGYEDEILAELLRVARRHLVLVEPSYEYATADARARMERLGYVRGLPESLARLGHAPSRVERCPHNSNPLNEAALIVVDKPNPSVDRAQPPAFVSPISGCKLVPRRDCWFCPEDGHAFPVIAGIPCLLVDNSVLASKLESFGQAR
jgi:SAM-dependent methyltransferase